MKPRSRLGLSALVLFTAGARVVAAEDGTVLTLRERAADWRLANLHPKTRPNGWGNDAFQLTGIEVRRLP
jgi:hypothetical protein